MTFSRILPITMVAAALTAAPALAETGSYTGPNGGDVSRVYDPVTGQYVATKNRVGVNGNTRTVQRQCQVGQQIENTGACGSIRTMTGTEGKAYTNKTGRIVGPYRFRAGRHLTNAQGQKYNQHRRYWLPQND